MINPSVLAEDLCHRAQARRLARIGETVPENSVPFDQLPQEDQDNWKLLAEVVLERERERRSGRGGASLHDYSSGDLLELAEWRRPEDVHLGATQGPLEGVAYTGVVLPRDYQEGAIMTAKGARKLAAQLLRVADLHDAIFDAGFHIAEELRKDEIRQLRSVLSDVYDWMKNSEGQGKLRYTEALERVAEALGRSSDLPPRPPGATRIGQRPIMK